MTTAYLQNPPFISNCVDGAREKLQNEVLPDILLPLLFAIQVQVEVGEHLGNDLIPELLSWQASVMGQQMCSITVTAHAKTIFYLVTTALSLVSKTAAD